MNSTLSKQCFDRCYSFHFCPVLQKVVSIVCFRDILQHFFLIDKKNICFGHSFGYYWHILTTVSLYFLIYDQQGVLLLNWLFSLIYHYMLVLEDISTLWFHVVSRKFFVYLFIIFELTLNTLKYILLNC